MIYKPKCIYITGKCSIWINGLGNQVEKWDTWGTYYLKLLHIFHRFLHWTEEATGWRNISSIKMHKCLIYLVQYSPTARILIIKDQLFVGFTIFQKNKHLYCHSGWKYFVLLEPLLSTLSKPVNFERTKFFCCPNSSLLSLWGLNVFNCFLWTLMFSKWYFPHCS